MSKICRQMYWKEGHFYGCARKAIKETREKLGFRGKLVLSNVRYGWQPPFGKVYSGSIKGQQRDAKN